MKQFSLGVGLVLLAFLTWRLGSSLSSDALGMAVGVVFGVLAGVPTALLVLASQRQRRPYDDDDDNFCSPTRQTGQPYPYQPPIIVLAAPREDKPQTVNNYTDNRSVTIHTAQSMPLIADRQREVATQQGGRVFRVVGEREEWEG